MSDTQLREIVAECFEIETDDLEVATEIRKIETFDSLSFLKLIVAIDEETGVEIEHTDLEQVCTVGDLEQLVTTKKAA